MRLLKYLCLVLAFCALPVALWAQVDTGSVSGTVTDPNGAVIPGAAVVATHVPTGRQYNNVTTQAGLYVFPNLPTGPYTLTVKQTGFKTFIQSGIEVRVGLRITIDIKLELGTVQQTVEVKATAPVLETTNATRGVGISPQTLMNLPLWNGSIELASSFVSYMPGVNSNFEASITGSIGRASELMIDGTSIVIPESGGTNFEFPGFYAFSEMKLVTSGYTAENGRVGGGIQEYVTRSGTNAVHGAALFDFKRQFLDAVSWANNQNPAQRGSTSSSGVVTVPTLTDCKAPSTKACRPKERFNEEGGYAGGPVYIPHIYDGRNRTFWYFTWVGFWQPASVAVYTPAPSVPTAAMKQGNFSNVLDSKGNLIPIFDPATTANGVRTQFSGNIIPTNRFSTIAKNIIPYIPDPNTGVAGQYVNNYTFNSTTVNLNHIWSYKIDHSIHQRNRISFFMSHRQDISSVVQYLPGPLSNGLDSFQLPFHENASDTFVINPHMVLHSVWGFHQDRQQWNNPLQNGFGTKFGFPFEQPNTQQNATPRILFATDLPMYNDGSNSGYLSFGMDQGKVNAGGQWNWTTSVAQDLTWVHNKHEFKMGWDIRRMRTTGNDWAGTNGQYFFSNNETKSAAGSAGVGGFSFASFLLGAVDSGNKNALPVFIGQTRYGYHAGFFQDTWRIRPKFTINLGLRYEVPINWHNVVGDYSSFSPTATNPTAGNLPGAMIFMGSGPNRIGTLRPYPTDFSDFGPRLGFAWNVRPSVVIRAAWGIFYEGLGNGGCGCEDGFGGGNFQQASDGFNPAFYWDPGAYNPNALTNNPGGVQPPASFKPAQQIPGVDNFGSGIAFMGPKFGKAPRVYDGDFTLQKEYHNWLFEGAYTRIRSVGLNSSAYINTLPTSVLYLGTAGPAGDTNLLQAKITDPNICTYTAAISCTNGVPNLPFPTFMQWGGSATLNQALRPYPQFGSVVSLNSGDGRNWYDAFQFKTERRFGDMNMMASYVWSKTLNILSYRQIFGQGTQQGAQDWYHMTNDKAYQIEDMPHVVNLMMSYQAPFGRGKKWLSNTNPVLNHFVEGWIFSMYGQYRSGSLSNTILNPNATLQAETFGTLTKLTATGNPIKTNVSTSSLDPNNPNIYWLNHGSNAPYTVTPPFTLGNFSYYNSQIRDPWYRYEAFSLNKRIKIWESVLVNYQFNVYNPFNRTDFGGLSTNPTASNFGRVTGARLGPRNITMGLRLEF